MTVDPHSLANARDRSREASRATVSVLTTTAETIIPVPSLTLDQADYLRELRRRETDFDRSIVIGGVAAMREGRS
jgi:hypothetical protein